MVVDEAYAACLRLAQRHYENFPVASRLVPRASRRHVAAIYAFARTADDFADEGDRSVAERLALLEDWQRRLDAAATGEIEDDSLAVDLEATKARRAELARVGGERGIAAE